MPAIQQEECFPLSRRRRYRMISPFLFPKRTGKEPSRFLPAGMQEGAKMEPASDSNLSAPIKGTDRKLTTFFVSHPRRTEKKIEETKESIPSVWRNVSEKEWNDWRWQLRHRITTLDQLKEILELIPEEIEGIKHSKGRLALAVTPYFASLMDPTNPNCPIRRQAIPRVEELHLSKNDMVDPLRRG